MNANSPWLFRALQFFAAAAIALSLAHWLGLERPFWAAMPVWVVAQPHRQDLLLRAVLRVVGTLIGAAIGWATLTGTDSTVIWIAVLAIAVGLSAAGSYWIGTIYSYGLQLAGITVAVVLVPAMDHTIDAARLAEDGIWCTLIGVIAITAISFLFTPKRPEPRPLRSPPPPGVVVRHGLIATGAAVAGSVVLLILQGPAGIAAALSLCIFSVLIGAARNPTPMLTSMLPGVAIGITAALLYRLVDQATGDPVGMAIITAMPFLAFGALLRAKPATAGLGIDANMAFLLAAEAGTAGHPMADHLLGGIAMLACAALFITVFKRLSAPLAPS